MCNWVPGPNLDTQGEGPSLNLVKFDSGSKIQPELYLLAVAACPSPYAAGSWAGAAHGEVTDRD